MHGGVQVGEELHERHPVVGRLGQGVAPGPDDRPRTLAVALVDGPQVRGEVGRQLRLVGERVGLGVLLDEEVERVDDHEVGHERDVDVELADLLREHQARLPVAERVLLPVHEVLGRRDTQRVGVDRRPAVRRGPQPHDVRAEGDGTVEPVGRAMAERHLDRHGPSLPHPCFGSMSASPDASALRRG
ncbi:hypothetical protein QE370_003004 [Aeromicrobium sp. SORGH_AS981]|nr:hypothetical protein [Aeromicrobium sp. SORGH_AS_0981]